MSLGMIKGKKVYIGVDWEDRGVICPASQLTDAPNQVLDPVYLSNVVFSASNAAVVTERKVNDLYAPEDVPYFTPIPHQYFTVTFTGSGGGDCYLGFDSTNDPAKGFQLNTSVKTLRVTFWYIQDQASVTTAVTAFYGYWVSGILNGVTLGTINLSSRPSTGWARKTFDITLPGSAGTEFVLQFTTTGASSLASFKIGGIMVTTQAAGVAPEFWNAGANSLYDAVGDDALSADLMVGFQDWKSLIALDAKASVTLTNADRKYSVFNSSIPLIINKDRSIRDKRLIIGVETPRNPDPAFLPYELGSLIPLYMGYVDGYNVSTGIYRERQVTITATSGLNTAAETKVTDLWRASQAYDITLQTALIDADSGRLNFVGAPNLFRLGKTPLGGGFLSSGKYTILKDINAAFVDNTKLGWYGYPKDKDITVREAFQRILSLDNTRFYVNEFGVGRMVRANSRVIQPDITESDYLSANYEAGMEEFSSFAVTSQNMTPNIAEVTNILTFSFSFEIEAGASASFVEPINYNQNYGESPQTSLTSLTVASQINTNTGVAGSYVDFNRLTFTDTKVPVYYNNNVEFNFTKTLGDVVIDCANNQSFPVMVTIEARGLPLISGSSPRTDVIDTDQITVAEAAIYENDLLQSQALIDRFLDAKSKFYGDGNKQLITDITIAPNDSNPVYAPVGKTFNVTEGQTGFDSELLCIGSSFNFNDGHVLQRLWFDYLINI